MRKRWVGGQFHSKVGLEHHSGQQISWSNCTGPLSAHLSSSRYRYSYTGETGADFRRLGSPRQITRLPEVSFSSLPKSSHCKSRPLSNPSRAIARGSSLSSMSLRAGILSGMCEAYFITRAPTLAHYLISSPPRKSRKVISQDAS